MVRELEVSVEVDLANVEVLEPNSSEIVHTRMSKQQPRRSPENQTKIGAQSCAAFETLKVPERS